MMMTMKKGVCLVMCLIMVAVTVVPTAAAVTCASTELSPCVGAVMAAVPQQPSQECCNKLKEQTPCLCGYMKDPSLSNYVNSGNARNVATACGVTIPNC